MAYLTLTGGAGKVDWRVNDLQSAFNLNNYWAAGITGNAFTDGASSITGIADQVTAPATGTNRFAAGSRSYTSGTFYFHGFARAANGLYYGAGGQWVTIQPVAVRPQNWFWSGVSSGAEMVSASQWNSFTQRINEFRAYKGLAAYPINTAFSGNPITALAFNQALIAISAMTNVGLTNRVSGEIIYAGYFTTLSNALNSIT
jgi:hypothetical protein